MTEASFQSARKIMQRANYLRGLITVAKGNVAKWTKIENVHREEGRISQADGCKKLLDRAMIQLSERKKSFADLKFPDDNIITSPAQDKCNSCSQPIPKGNKFCDECAFIEHL